jgi:hypothetical protein
LKPDGTRVLRTRRVKQGSPHISSSSTSGECRRSLLSCRALSTRACVAISLAVLALGGSCTTTVGRGLFCLGALSGGVLVLANAVPITPTPVIAMLYNASLGSPRGGLFANIKA